MGGWDPLNLRNLFFEAPGMASDVFTDTNFWSDWATLADSSELKLPWETGFWNEMLGTGERFVDVKDTWKQRRPPILLSCTEEVIEAVTKKPRLVDKPFTWQRLVQSNADQSWMDKREADFQVALRRWFDAIHDLPEDIEVVKQLQEMTSIGDQLRMMRDLFWKKSPQTLIKRVHSFLRFKQSIVDRKLTFPGTEADFYAFLDAERLAGAPGSRLQSIIESLVFAQHVLGMSQLSHLTSSRRCFGVGSKCTQSKGKQASPFTLDELKTLHAILRTEELDDWDRAFAGMVLCAVYSRSRWSDLQQADECVVDGDFESMISYLEFPISQHKTKFATAFRNCFLHACAPGTGVTYENWAAEWLVLRNKLNIQLGDGRPTFPAPREDGTPSMRALSTQEMKAWVVALLQNNGHDLDSRRITSHSCKTTMLSWLSKMGVSFEDRLILGGHVGHVRSAVVYSRDALGRPLRILEDMLEQVRQGLFVPDANRSGRFVAPQMSEELPESGVFEPRTDSAADISDPAPETLQAVIKIEDDDDNDFGFEKIDSHDPAEASAESVMHGESSEDDGDNPTSSSSDSEAGELSGARRPVRMPEIPGDLKMVQHVKLRTLHLMELQNDRVMLCGRIAEADRYCKVSETRFDTPCCVTCWRNKKKYET